ncbi:MAG: diguanylate cyclase [Cyanobacteria bacterium P01_A01_bin.45]
MFSPYNFSLQEVIEFHPPTVRPDTSLEEIVTLLSQRKTSYVLVTENKHLLGIYTERDIVFLVANSQDSQGLMIADVMSKKLICIKQSEITDIFRILGLMRHHKIRHIPVVTDNDELIGAIALKNIRNCLKPSDMLRLRQVNELMEYPVVHAHPQTSLIDIVGLMAQNKISCVVIAQRTETQELFPVGIITEMDIVRLQAEKIDMNATKACIVMSKPIKPVKSTDTLWCAHSKMQQLNIRRLVVVDEDSRLCGIITQSSLLKVLDPLEMQALVNVLQQTVEEKTQQLQQLNRDLQVEIQQRQQVEIALRESETRYRNIANQQGIVSQKLELLNKQLKQLANCDPLTELANRRHFNEYFYQIWQRLSVEKKCLSAIMCDCDYFKSYNDAYGHQKGDECLFQIAKFLKKTVTRPDDLVARYGGEEFIILLPDTTLENAVCIAQKIQLGVKFLNIPHSQSLVSNMMTVSLGVASTVPQLNIDVKTLIEKADKALYQAKAKGRNAIVAV